MTLDPERPVSVRRPLKDCPIVVLDFETTGLTAAAGAVEVGLVRFEAGELVGTHTTRINPGIPIPPETSKIHGITDQDVAEAPTLEQAFAAAPLLELLQGAAPAAYSARYDRMFVPWAMIDNVLSPRWPWLDPLITVRQVDRFVRGRGRHSLVNTCARHGISLTAAHSAGADAEASGALLCKLAREHGDWEAEIGAVLQAQEAAAAGQWLDFERYMERSK